MKRRSVTAVIAAFAMFIGFALTGCGGVRSKTIPPTLQNTQTFITLVDNIETPVSVRSGAYIQSAFLVYDVLTDAEKANADVATRKAKLDEYKTNYEQAKRQAEIEAERLSEEKRKTKFIGAVNSLPEELLYTDRAAITEAYGLYAELKTESQSDAAVSAAYAKLRAADAEVEQLEIAEHERIVKETAEKFIEDVESIDEVTLESVDVIENLLYDYDDFDNDVKAYAGVADAKAKLDEAAHEYKALKDEKDVEDFLELAAGLAPVESITLESESNIIKAERLFRNMSNEAKAADGVEGAYADVVAAREKFDVLFAAAERIKADAFIAAAAKINEDITDLDISWFDVLDEASRAYNELAYETRSQSDVEEAFNKYNKAQTAFDAKGYKQIPMANPLLQFSGDNPPFLVMPNYTTTASTLCEFYGAKGLSELSGKVKLWLNVYVVTDGEYEYVGRTELDIMLMGNMIIHSDKIQPAMRKLAAENDKVVSGGVYAFSLNFEDAESKYIPSGKTNIVYQAGKTYTW